MTLSQLSNPVVDTAMSLANDTFGEYSLQLIKQPPQHVFPDNWFDVELSFETRHNFSRLPDELSLRAELHIHDGTMPRRDPCGDDVAELVGIHSKSHSKSIDDASLFCASNIFVR